MVTPPEPQIIVTVLALNRAAIASVRYFIYYKIIKANSLDLTAKKIV
jgi:hypothetical protein